ncbi:hypothetical protein [Streptomyces sp. NPDC059802]|uniref:hypothetical protein n=1 Tax=Streptomyces sp. NPDC059802 TaxID=3346952 RepID=UPI00365EE6A3
MATIAMALLDGLTNRLLTDPDAPSLDEARRLAGHQLACATGFRGTLPFQPLPHPGPPPPQPPANRAAPTPPRTTSPLISHEHLSASTFVPFAPLVMLCPIAVRGVSCTPPCGLGRTAAGERASPQRAAWSTY